MFMKPPHDNFQVIARKDIIRVLTRSESPAGFMSMQRNLGLDFSFNCKQAELRGEDVSRNFGMEGFLNDEYSKALNWLVKRGIVKIEWHGGEILYSMDPLLAIRFFSEETQMEEALT
jgi:hypothetical protein